MNEILLTTCLKYASHAVAKERFLSCPGVAVSFCSFECCYEFCLQLGEREME